MIYRQTWTVAEETLVYLSGRDISKSMKQREDVFSVNKLDEWLYNKYRRLPLSRTNENQINTFHKWMCNLIPEDSDILNIYAEMGRNQSR